MNNKQKTNMLNSFSRSFWVANFMELFERGAYYGMNAALAVYLTSKISKGGLGFSEDKVGLLQGIVYAVTYVFPILGGALADRYGYRKMLMFAFSILSLGYFLTSQVTAYGMVFSTLLLMAVGSGLFKPIVSGTIARTTDEKTSGFGFGIYYWMINLGALVAPGVAMWLRGFSWSYVFIASSAYCALMLIPTIFVYRDPPKPESTQKLKEVLAGAAVVLSDARFMLLIFVYSCFWILYFQNFGTVLWYLRDFVDPTPVNNLFTSMGLNTKLSAEHVTMANAGTIVLLQIVVSKICKNIKPLITMCVGIFIGSIGFFVLSTSQHAFVFLAGIVIFTMGEMTCHPKYISYIGLIAPSDKKAVYMGYGFLYGVIGSLFGSNIGGEMYTSFLTPLVGRDNINGELRNFWIIFAILGLCTMGALIIYNKLFGEDTSATRLLAKKVMIGLYSVLIIASIAIIIFVFSATNTLPPKTCIQSGILAVIGFSGLYTLLKVKHVPS